MFSLSINNHKGEEPIDPLTARGIAALRTSIAVRDAAGNDAVGRFYAAIGPRIFDELQRADDPECIEGALTEAGLDPALRAAALADGGTWERLQAEHHGLVSATRSFGVPTICLNGGAGPAIFGPVIANPPDNDDEARELWRCVSWLTRYENFAELKRDRTIDPDLESYRALRRRWAAKD